MEDEKEPAHAIWITSPALTSSLPLSVVFATLHAVGFRAVLPPVRRKGAGPAVPALGTHATAGRRRVLYSKQGGPLGIPHRLVPFLWSRRRCSCCCCYCCVPVGQHRRPGRSQRASPPDPMAREVVGLRGPIWSCVGSATSAHLGSCCPGRGESSSGRVKQHMTVSPCGRMQQGNHPGQKVGSTAYCNSCSGESLGGGGYVDGGGGQT